MSVRQAQDEIDSAEYSEWLAYDSLEPFGPRRDDFRSAILSATIRQEWTGHKTEPADYMPKFGDEADAVQPRESHEATMQARLLTAAGGNITYGDNCKSGGQPDGENG